MAYPGRLYTGGAESVRGEGVEKMRPNRNTFLLKINRTSARSVFNEYFSIKRLERRVNQRSNKPWITQRLEEFSHVTKLMGQETNTPPLEYTQTAWQFDPNLLMTKSRALLTIFLWRVCSERPQIDQWLRTSEIRIVLWAKPSSMCHRPINTRRF